MVQGPVEVKPKILKLVCVSSLLRTQYYRVRAKTPNEDNVS